MKVHAFLCIALLLVSQARAHATDHDVILRGATIIDGTGSRPIIADIHIRGDKVEAVISDGKGAEIPDAKVVDYAGKFIMPGLVSVHSHVGQIDGLENGRANFNRQNILRQLRQYEVFGVTTVTALGVNAPQFYEIRAGLHSGELPGADLFGADRGIGVADGAPPAAALKVGDDQVDRPATPEQARAAVRAAKDRGTDLIKFWIDDFGGTLPKKLPPEIYQAVIDEAHQQNLRVAAHVFYLQDAKDVIEAGVDILAHGVRDQPVDEALIELMKTKGVRYVPTIGVDEANFIHAANPELLKSQFYRHSLQPPLLAQFKDATWRDRTLANPALTKWKQNVAVNQRNVKALHDAGISIGLGADSGANPLRIPGFAEHRELQLLCAAGIDPIKVITIATRDSAALLGLTDRGTITSGHLADLVVLDADPSEDIANTERIRAVWHRGQKVADRITDFTP